MFNYLHTSRMILPLIVHYLNIAAFFYNKTIGRLNSNTFPRQKSTVDKQ